MPGGLEQEFRNTQVRDLEIAFPRFLFVCSWDSVGYCPFDSPSIDDPKLPGKIRDGAEIHVTL